MTDARGWLDKRAYKLTIDLIAEAEVTGVPSQALWFALLGEVADAFIDAGYPGGVSL